MGMLTGAKVTVRTKPLFLARVHIASGNITIVDVEYSTLLPLIFIFKVC
jgi:hypothetical protein